MELRRNPGCRVAAADARALVSDPLLLLADEPTSNLDRRSATELIALLAELHAQGLTVVVATHDPDLLALATRNFTMHQGRLVKEA